MIKRFMKIIVALFVFSYTVSWTQGMDEKDINHFEQGIKYTKKSMKYQKKINWRDSERGRKWENFCAITLIGLPLLKLYNASVDHKRDENIKKSRAEFELDLKYFKHNYTNVNDQLIDLYISNVELLY